MAQYRLKATAQAERLERAAAAHSEEAREANEHADNDMLAVVLFATSLFFAGISGKMGTMGARTAVLGLGCVVFVGTLIWLATLPVHLTA